jgi:hypothetical protein
MKNMTKLKVRENDMKSRHIVPWFRSYSFISIILHCVLAFLLIAVVNLAFIVIPVFAVPAITASSLPNGQVNVYYATTLSASPLSGSYAWSVTSGSLPPGLTLTATSGAIAGTPTTIGTYAFTVIVTDTTGPSTAQTFSITIAAPPLSIYATSLAQGKEGTAYSASLSATGGTTPYYWTIIDGYLPSGLSLTTSGGYITGTPIRGSSGTYTFTVNVSDSSSTAQSAQRSFTIYIEKGLFVSTITINSSLKAGSTKVYVGGTSVNNLKGGESITLNFDLGVTRTISVEPLVNDPSDSGIRYRTDDESATVSESQPNVEFSYYPEYQVTATASPSVGIQPSGSGWYKKGAAANLSTTADAQGNTGVLYKFSYWLPPSNQKVTTEQLNFTVENPTTVTAYYDTYYKLTTDSIYGEIEGDGWYKVNSEAHWSLISDKVSMEGLVGFFQGKYVAAKSSGTELMDGPKKVVITWRPDYSLPYILIPLAILGIVLVIVGLYFLLRGQQPRPQPQQMSAVPPLYTPPYVVPPYSPPYTPPPQPRPIPQQHTTVVMIGDNKPSDTTKQLPTSTKEELMARFGELLEKYESEIKSTSGIRPEALPRVETFPQEKMISAPPPVSPSAGYADFTQKESEEQPCRYTAKKLLRTVARKWEKTEGSTVELPPTTEGETKGNTGLLVVWSRYIFYEWEILNCSLLLHHPGEHRGATNTVYTLLNTITEKKVYSPDEKELLPPVSHYTEGLSEVDIPDEQIVSAAELPTETRR